MLCQINITVNCFIERKMNNCYIHLFNLETIKITEDNYKIGIGIGFLTILTISRIYIDAVKEIIIPISGYNPEISIYLPFIKLYK